MCIKNSRTWFTDTAKLLQRILSVLAVPLPQSVPSQKFVLKCKFAKTKKRAKLFSHIISSVSQKLSQHCLKNFPKYFPESIIVSKNFFCFTIFIPLPFLPYTHTQAHRHRNCDPHTLQTSKSYKSEGKKYTLTKKVCRAEMAVT